MGDKYQYRLTKIKKSEIAQNLIDILKKNAPMSKDTKRFVGDWILTGAGEKRKAFFDVWDIVLRSYLPTKRPILFRSCKSIRGSGRIASFTGKLECARRFSKHKGFLIVCDTKESLEFEKSFYKKGAYKHTFYPLSDVLRKAKDTGGSGFSYGQLEYICEDEYIMRMDLGTMRAFKWIDSN